MGPGDMLGINVDLNDLSGLGKIIDVILGQRAEHGQSRTDCQHHISLGEDLHRRLGAHVADRAHK